MPRTSIGLARPDASAEGLRREVEVEPEDSITAITGRRVTRITLIAPGLNALSNAVPMLRD